MSHTKQTDNEVWIDACWSEYKFICNLNKLVEKIQEAPESDLKNELLLKIHSKVPQAAASDTIILMEENSILRNKVAYLEKCVDDNKTEMVHILAKLRENHQLETDLNNLLNRIPRWKKWLCGFDIDF